MAELEGKIQFWFKTAAQWVTDNDILDEGQPGVEVDTGQMKVGDNITAWNDLDYVGSVGDVVWGTITGTLSNQTDLQSQLNTKANLASPTFTGNPTAPTQTAGNDSTRLATTAFVQAALATKYQVYFQCDLTSPADATTYFIGTSPMQLQTTGSVTHGAALATGTIYAAIICSRNNAVNSNETSSFYVSINGGADQTLTTNFIYVNPTTISRITGLNIAVTAGDDLVVKTTTPTWVTNPTNVALSVVLFIR